MLLIVLDGLTTQRKRNFKTVSCYSLLLLNYEISLLKNKKEKKKKTIFNLANIRLDISHLANLHLVNLRLVNIHLVYLHLIYIWSI